ncbi:hypothetical protein GIB67_033973, partial [Kingdonia uniflora]
IHLFGKNSKTLEWKMRYQIAPGTARGLAYLHEECRNYIIHYDIKPENILLDVVNFFPRVENSRACNIACWCIQEGEMNKPAMGYVVQVLEGVVEVGISPVPLYLQNHVNNLGHKRDGMECSGESSLVAE